MTAAPTVVRPGLLLLNGKPTARLSLGSDEAFWQAMQSIHDRIESLSWNKRVRDPDDSENQDGFLRALGYKRATAADRVWPGDLDTEQGNNGDDDLLAVWPQSPAESMKDLGQQSFVDQKLWSGIDFGSEMKGALGTSSIRLLDPSAADSAATSGWSANFHYSDSDTKRLPLPKVQLTGRGRLGLSSVSYESLDVYLPVMLYPRTTLVGDNEWHSDGLFFGAYVEGEASTQSALVSGFTQAPSTLVTVGLKTGVNF